MMDAAPDPAFASAASECSETTDAVTVLRSISGDPVNKIVRRLDDGSIAKAMARNNGCFVAQTVPVPDLDAMADLLAKVGSQPDCTLSLGVFKNAPAEPFVVWPAAKLAARLGIDPNDRDGLIGSHEIDGRPTIARLKENMSFGAWHLVDRDMVDGMPAELAGLDHAAWLAAMDRLLPGIASAGHIMVPSSSQRVVVDGSPLQSTSCHLYVQVDDPGEIKRVWPQLLPKSFLVTVEADASTMLGFLRPKRSRSDPDQIVAWQPWTIFDPSTASPERLVFDGAPVARGDGIEIAAPQIEIQDGPRLALSAFEDLADADLPKIEHAAQVKVRLERGGNGPGVRVTGVSITSPTLSMGLEVETKKGWTTIQKLKDEGAGHTRCQSPFRDSSSWAAFYDTRDDGSPFVYDSGANIKYVLPGEQQGDALYDLSHDGLALDMGRRWRRDARHVALWGKWLLWTGSSWSKDETLQHMTRTRDHLRRRADDMVRAAKTGKLMPEEVNRDKVIAMAEAQAKTLRNKGTIASVADLARSNAELVATVDQWDADLFAIGRPAS